MDRRSFGKLVGGVAATTILPDPASKAFTGTQATTGPGRGNGNSEPAFREVHEAWELTLLDAAPPGCGEIGGAAVGDIDGDGKAEVVVSASGALLWYNPRTFDRGEIALGIFNVGVAIEDLDGDGHREIVASRRADPQSAQGEQWRQRRSLDRTCARPADHWQPA
jgi:hypothetical protein